MSINDQLDARDREILSERIKAFNKNEGPRVGDYIQFSNGVTRRIAYIWPGGPSERTIQTSDSGNFYLGNGFCEMSGSLFPSVPANTLTYSGEKRQGIVWFFHHNYREANNSVQASIAFRLYSCSLSSDDV